MTLPVMEPDLWAAEDTLERWARTVDEGPWSSLCFGERIAFDNPDALWGHESEQLEVLATRNAEKKSIKVEKIVEVRQK